MFSASISFFLTEDDVPGAKLNKPPSEFNVSDLKRPLDCHGEKKGTFSNEDGASERQFRKSHIRLTLYFSVWFIRILCSQP